MSRKELTTARPLKGRIRQVTMILHPGFGCIITLDSGTLPSIEQNMITTGSFPDYSCPYFKEIFILFYITNFKVLGKQSFSVCFPPTSCFMQISFHLFCKVCTTHMNIFFVWYLHVIYLHYKYIDTPRITCYPIPCLSYNRNTYY
jgi:hypothetical protein